MFCVPYLNSVLGQVRLEREHLPGVHVGVVSILESLLQLVQLIEDPNLTLISAFDFVVKFSLGVAVAAAAAVRHWSHYGVKSINFTP